MVNGKMAAAKVSLDRSDSTLRNTRNIYTTIYLPHSTHGIIIFTVSNGMFLYARNQLLMKVTKLIAIV